MAEKGPPKHFLPRQMFHEMGNEKYLFVLVARRYLDCPALRRRGLIRKVNRAGLGTIALKDFHEAPWG